MSGEESQLLLRIIRFLCICPVDPQPICLEPGFNVFNLHAVCVSEVVLDGHDWEWSIVQLSYIQ